MSDRMFVLVAALVPLADVVEQIINENPRNNYTAQTMLEEVQMRLIQLGDWATRVFSNAQKSQVEVDLSEIQVALDALVLQKKIAQSIDEKHYGSSIFRQKQDIRFVIHIPQEITQTA